VSYQGTATARDANTAAATITVKELFCGSLSQRGVE